MPIKQITPQQAVAQYLQNELAKREKLIFNALARLGEECIIEARTNGDYLDQTANLRHSVGYAILKSGEMVLSSSFHKPQSAQQSTALLEQVRTELNQGWALVVVAGMNYAAYVETRRNVISSAEIWAKQQAPLLLKKLFKK